MNVNNEFKIKINNLYYKYSTLLVSLIENWLGPNCGEALLKAGVGNDFFQGGLLGY